MRQILLIAMKKLYLTTLLSNIANSSRDSVKNDKGNKKQPSFMKSRSTHHDSVVLLMNVLDFSHDLKKRNRRKKPAILQNTPGISHNTL